MQESSPTALRYLQDLSDTRPPTLIKGGPGSRTTLSTTISTLPFHEGLLARTNHVSTCALALSLKTRVLWLVVLFVLLQPTLPTVYLFTERDQLHQLLLRSACDEGGRGLACPEKRWILKKMQWLNPGGHLFNG